MTRSVVARGEVRLIGGRYRGRRIPVSSLPGLRPTPDRVRETLFNWLHPLIEGARCLDLFAGSGAIGFEAASRGAREVVMVEQARALVRVLVNNAHVLGAEQVRIEQAESIRWLSARGSRFDIVFLDPPFDAGLLEPALRLLECNGWLAPNARIYLETSARTGLPLLPVSWQLEREKVAGQVRYALAVAGKDVRESD